MDLRACENKTCPHNEVFSAFCACAWGSLSDILACKYRKQPAPAQMDEVEKLRDQLAAAQAENARLRGELAELDKARDLWHKAAVENGQEIKRLNAALEVAQSKAGNLHTTLTEARVISLDAAKRAAKITGGGQ
jgi:hypothetical protein